MKQAKPAVVFLCSGLNFPGGTERAIVNTAHLLQHYGHAVSILILDKTTESFYPINAGIDTRKADLHFGMTKDGNTVTRKISFLKNLRQLRNELQTISAPVVIATSYVYAVGARIALKNGFQIYAWEHHAFGKLHKNHFWNFLSSRIYQKLDGVICLNKTEAALYESTGCKAITIPNFIQRAPEPAQLFQKRILTIGRLSRGKGIDLIPEIAEGVFKKFKDWHWKIIGEGEAHGLLKKLILEKNLETYIEICKPATHNVSNEYAAASLYVMTSRHECFPMVLLEAMSAGVPCIAFDCPTGPAHLIQNGTDGVLVETENITAMAEAISKLIADEEERKHMGAAAYKNMERFAPEKIYELWQSLLQAE